MKKTFKTPVHCGNLVRKILKDKGLKHKLVYEKLGYNKGSFSLLLSKSDWTVGQIFAVSEIIKVNLFPYFIKGNKNKSGALENSLVYEANSLELKLLECQQELKELKEFKLIIMDSYDFQKKRVKELEEQLNGVKALARK